MPAAWFVGGMDAPRHTPYDGSSKLFQIGLKPLDPADWIDVDDRLADYLDEKQRLIAADLGEVFVAEAGAEPAQSEVLRLLVGYLPERFPDIYRRDGGTMDAAGRRVDLADGPPLLTAARLVQEDLVVLQRDAAGWRLTAGVVCFPSSWRVRDKFGRPVEEIHGPVPGFGPGSRPAELINRMFDNLRAERPMIRWNWSLYGDAMLPHPLPSPTSRRYGQGERADHVFLRTERQTLRKLPETGAILFTVRIGVDPLEALERHPSRGAIAQALTRQLWELDDAQLDYKGMTTERERLVRRFTELIG
jgi:hypothetical protein